jgi:hypothetical protein
MSVKSALGLKQSSGQIGQQIKSYLTTSSVSVPAGISSGNLITITLPAGVWSVDGRAWIQFNSGTDLSSGFMEIYIRNTDGTSFAVNTTANPVQGEIWTEVQSQFSEVSAILDVSVDTDFVLFYNSDYASGGVSFQKGSGGAIGTGIIATRLA